MYTEQRRSVRRAIAQNHSRAVARALTNNHSGLWPSQAAPDRT